MPEDRGGGVKSVGVPSTTPTHRYFVLSPVSLASRDHYGGPSNSTIDIYDLTEKLGTEQSNDITT